jgi:hypothetical protein
MCHGQMLGDALLKARRDHRIKCNFCKRPIMKGQEYRESVSKDGHEFMRWKAHLVCEAMSQEASNLNYDGCSWDPRVEALDVLHHVGFAAFKAKVRASMQRVREVFARRRSA